MARRKATAAEKARAKQLEADLRRTGKLARYRSLWRQASIGGQSYCDVCNISYEMDDFTQYLAHDHTV